MTCAMFKLHLSINLVNFDNLDSDAMSGGASRGKVVEVGASGSLKTFKGRILQKICL